MRKLRWTAALADATWPYLFSPFFFPLSFLALVWSMWGLFWTFEQVGRGQCIQCLWLHGMPCVSIFGRTGTLPLLPHLYLPFCKGTLRRSEERSCCSSVMGQGEYPLQRDLGPTADPGQALGQDANCWGLGEKRRWKEDHGVVRRVAREAPENPAAPLLKLENTCQMQCKTTIFLTYKTTNFTHLLFH